MDRHNLWHEIYQLSLAICTPWFKVAVSFQVLKLEVPTTNLQQHQL